MPEINIPVDITPYANVVANNPHNTSSDWSLGCYDVLKGFIKTHYSVIQDDLCCYCKVSLRHAAYGEPIEHIVPKSDRPRWMFEPRNLALSCYPCNTKKSADNTLSVAGRASVGYPTTEAGFIIYHPHYNNWDTHFEVFHQYFLKPRTPKGRETFNVCQMYRFSLPLDKAKMKGLEEGKIRTKVIAKVLNDPSLNDDIVHQCIEISIEIIERAKLKLQILGN